LFFDPVHSVTEKCVVLTTDHSFKKVKVCLSPEELQMCVGGLPLSGHYINNPVCNVWQHCVFYFSGQSNDMSGVFRHQLITVVPPPFRPGNPALCGSRPLVIPYYCRLGDLLCFVFMSAYCTFDLSVYYLFLQYFDTVGWVFW